MPMKRNSNPSAKNLTFQDSSLLGCDAVSLFYASTTDTITVSCL